LKDYVHNQEESDIHIIFWILFYEREMSRFVCFCEVYYRDIWAQQREMLAPLSNFVGEGRHTKVTKANKTKKVPWHRDKIHQQAFENVKATIAKDVTLAFR
jgi:hypothetical protein